MKTGTIFIIGLIITLIIGSGFLYLNKNTSSDEGFYKGKSKEGWGCANIRDISDDDCYYKIVKDSNYAEYPACYSIQDEDIKLSCIVDSWKILKNPAVCESINFKHSTGGELKIDVMDSCYNSIAKDLKDVSFCEKTVGVDAKDFCYYSYAFSLKDASVCDKLSGTGGYPYDEETCIKNANR